VLAAVIVCGAYLALLPRTGADLRYQFWGVAWNVFLASPITGSGPGAFARAWLETYPALPAYPHAHNIVLQALADYGLFGLAVLACVVFYFVRRVWPLRYEPTTYGLLLGMLALAVHSIVDVPTWDLGVLTVALICAGVALR
jgi:O-antigen ligase